MNFVKIFNVLGKILYIEAALLAIPMIVSFIYNENIFLYYIATIGLTVLFALLFTIKKPTKDNIFAKDGYFIVALAWVLMSVLGALPFVFSGYIPNFVDAFFEVVSGFTTTGSTILSDIEALPHSLLFWRSFTHFIGGMGILVFVIAILPKTEGSDMHIMRAEVPGPTVGKLVSKIRVTARILYGIYFGMTVIMTVLLIVGGMDVFDAVVNSLATAGTGGFSVLNNGIAGYNSPYAEYVIAIFMVLFGVNFNLYYLAGCGNIKRALKDEELRSYIGIITVSTFLISLVLTVTRHPVKESIRLAFFQVASIISTTGFATADFDLWPVITKIILFLLMFVGGCVGSTGGGLKVSRILVLVKSSLRQIKRAINPRCVSNIKINQTTIDEDIVNGITGYFSAFMIVLAISILLVGIDNHDMLSTISGVVTCITNVGPGFNEVGPTCNFSSFSNLSKLILSFDMLAGRLELIPMFVIIFMRKNLKKNK